MEPRTMRRSASVRSTSRCTMPAPRSKPSRITYMAIIAATRQNQVVSMSEPQPRGGARFQNGLRSFVDCAIDQEQEENREDGVRSEERRVGEEGRSEEHT